MPFELPSEFQKEIATSTAKVYKTKLNKLASEGFGTVEALRSRPVEVIAAINRLSPGTGTEKERHAQRYYLCAIRWVLALPKKNRYYTYYQKILPLKVNGTEEPWVRRTNYKD
jgi:hypothetical protein